MNIRILTIFLITLTISLNSVYAQKDSPKDLVTKFLKIVEEKAYVSPTVKWDSVRPAFIEETKNVKALSELQPYFKKFLRSLKDGHSQIIYSESEDDDESEDAIMERYAQATYKSAGVPPPNFKHYIIDKKYAYINIPTVVIEQRNYIDTIGIQLTELDKSNPKAWIIDLTENEGGSIQPILWHFASLIDQIETYSDVDNKGHEKKQKKIYDEISEEDKRYYELFNFDYNKVKPKELKNNNIPIIILTSFKTSSAAEFFVASFKGQNNVKIIGQSTGRQTSGVEDFTLNKNYWLHLTTTVIKDRNGKIYKIGEGIEPDIHFEIDKKLKDYEKLEIKQKYLDAALKYLEQN